MLTRFSYPRNNIRTIHNPRDVRYIKDRIKAGFYPDVISDDLLNLIAEHASSAGDLRMGIDLLRVSGNFAEADASKTIEEKHVIEALKNTDSTSLKSTLKNPF